MPEAEVEQTTPAAVTEEATKEKALLAQEEAEAAATAAKDQEEKKDEEKKEASKDKEEDGVNKKNKKKKETPASPTPPGPVVHKKDFEKGTIYLYQFPRNVVLPCVSHKCLKVETWLKLHGLKYENVQHNSKLRSKRGLLPFVELDGEEIADSEIIIKELAQKYGIDMDKDLTSEQKNIQHAMLSMVDNHLNGAFMHWASRHTDNMLKGYKINLQQMMGVKIPNGLLAFAFKHGYCRKGLKKARAAGFNGYTDEEIDAAGVADLKVLRDMLADKQFFFGDNPHLLDLVTFCQLAQIINIDKDVVCPLRDILDEDCSNLVGLYNRMKDQAWGDHWDMAIGDVMDLNPHIPKPDPPKEDKPGTDDAKETEGKNETETADDNKKEADKEKGDKDEKEKEEEEGKK